MKLKKIDLPHLPKDKVSFIGNDRIFLIKACELRKKII